MSEIEILAAGPLVLVQDRGRLGYAHLGVPRAGALDPAAAALAGRLVGNAPDAAVLEILGGVRFAPTRDVWIAVTGAGCDLRIGDRAASHGLPERVRAGEIVVVGPARDGLRCWLAVSGGIASEPVLGSRSTDTLAWVGPPRVIAGMRLPLGERLGSPIGVDLPLARAAGPLRLLPGPHPDHFEAGALEVLASAPWVVQQESDRIGVRLARADGVGVPRRGGELPSEGAVTGAIQVPPDGRPVVLMHDHGSTGGYPVVAVVHPADLWQLAQARPGSEVRLARPRPDRPDRAATRD